MSGPEFSRVYPLDQIGSAWRALALEASDAECEALASRFALAAIHRLDATARMRAEASVIICEGSISAQVEQSCIATGLPIAVSVAQSFAIRFIPASPAPSVADQVEIEIDLDDHDIVEHDGRSIDVGEAVAQTLLLALDPFPRSPAAQDTLRAAGVIGDDEVINPAFAGLKSLLKS